MTEAMPTGETEVFRGNYVTIIMIAGNFPINSGYNNPEKVILTHESLADVVNYLQHHGYIVGEPAAGKAYAHVESVDGRQLSEAEREYLATNRVASREDYVSMFNSAAPSARAHIAVDQFLRELDEQPPLQS